MIKGCGSIISAHPDPPRSLLRQNISGCFSLFLQMKTCAKGSSNLDMQVLRVCPSVWEGTRILARLTWSLWMYMQCFLLPAAGEALSKLLLSASK